MNDVIQIKTRREMKRHGSRVLMYVSAANGAVTALDPFDAAGTFEFSSEDWGKLPAYPSEARK